MEAVIIRRNREAYSIVQFKRTSTVPVTTIGPILYIFLYFEHMSCRYIYIVTKNFKEKMFAKQTIKSHPTLSVLWGAFWSFL